MENNNNNKPIQLVIEEVKMKLNQDIANTVNATGLPMCIINPILKEIFDMCVGIEKQQYETVKAEYTKSQEQQNNEVQGVE